jgi:hypothetical protein
LYCARYRFICSGLSCSGSIDIEMSRTEPETSLSASRRPEKPAERSEHGVTHVVAMKSTMTGLSVLRKDARLISFPSWFRSVTFGISVLLPDPTSVCMRPAWSVWPAHQARALCRRAPGTTTVIRPAMPRPTKILFRKKMSIVPVLQFSGQLPQNQ